MSHQELLRALRLESAKEGSKARQEFELAARELAAKHERRLKMAGDELELRRKHELHEASEAGEPGARGCGATGRAFLLIRRGGAGIGHETGDCVSCPAGCCACWCSVAAPRLFPQAASNLAKLARRSRSARTRTSTS